MQANVVLRKARKTKEATLKEVSDATGIPLTTISSWERGASHPRGKNRTKIENFYGLAKGILKRDDANKVGIPMAGPPDSVHTQYEIREIMLHKNQWEVAEKLRPRYDAEDLSMLFSQLITDAKRRIAIPGQSV